MLPGMTDDFRHDQVRVGERSIHVVEAGDPDAAPVLFLHGWPESWPTWRQVMRRAAGSARAIAIDQPGIGGSTGATDGSTRQLAAVIHDLVTTMGLSGLTLVGHDLGGMMAYPYLRTFDDLDRAVIMDVVIPGVDPWEQVLRNPYIWHFSMHSIPDLPETLVTGRERAYFDFFYDVLSPDPTTITDEVRAAYVEAYRVDGALTAGFDWYRAFARDAEDNAALAAGPPTDTPLLYVRGEHEQGRIDDYLAGFRAAGLTDVTGAVIPGAGHFAQEDAPDAVWEAIRGFAGL